MVKILKNFHKKELPTPTRLHSTDIVEQKLQNWDLILGLSSASSSGATPKYP
jgi:hypothetical protein